MIYSLGNATPEFESEDDFVAPNATVIGNVSVGRGASIWFNAGIRGDNDRIRIGRNSNIQDGAVLHTDPGIELTIGDNVTVGHLAMLHGCSIGANTLIGIGSTIMNGARIGINCLIGAHTLVTEGKEFPDGVLITGAPARIVRELSAEEVAMLSTAAGVYVDHSRRYRHKLHAVTRPEKDHVG